LGNVQTSKAVVLQEQGKVEESEKYFDASFKTHRDALTQFESTLGKFHHRIGDICHKLAEHHIRRSEHLIAQYVSPPNLSPWD
jgi:hypothetical protein